MEDDQKRKEELKQDREMEEFSLRLAKDALDASINKKHENAEKRHQLFLAIIQSALASSYTKVEEFLAQTPEITSMYDEMVQAAKQEYRYAQNEFQMKNAVGDHEYNVRNIGDELDAIASLENNTEEA